MKAPLPFLLYFIFFHSSNTTCEHCAFDAGGINNYFMRATCPKTLPYAAPRREPETILLEEGEDADETGEDGLPKPIQVGNILFKCQVPTHNAEYSFADNAAGKRRLKRYLAKTNDGHDNDFDFDYGNTATTKLHPTNK